MAEHSSSLDAEIKRSILETFDPKWEKIQRPRIAELPASIYLADPTASDTLAVESAVIYCLGLIGFDLVASSIPERGSWWRRFLFRSREVLTSEQVSERLKKLERAVEIKALDLPQAQADNLLLDGAAKLLAAVGDNDTVTQQGSVIIVKYRPPDSDRAIVVIRNLTQRHLLYLEEHPAILKSPEEMVQLLQGQTKDQHQRRDDEPPQRRLQSY
jgi:hypothetical protein